MTFDSFKNRYCRAYEKQLRKINVIDPMLDDGKLHEAYGIYKQTDLWYHRAFRPSALAQMNVVYYDYQIRNAFPELDDEELLDLIYSDPQAIHERIRNSYYNNN